MFESLDDILWNTLHTAYGEASGVPGQLRALASENSGVRHAACDGLENSLYHQGGLYTAAAPAVQFLLEILNSTPEPLIVLELLAMLATVIAPREVRRNCEQMKRMGTSQTAISSYLWHANQLQTELAEGSNSIAQLLERVLGEDRLLCVEYLVCLENTIEAFPFLMQLTDDSNPLIRGMASAAIARRDSMDCGTLEGIFNESKCPLVRCLMALRLNADGTAEQRSQAATFLLQQLAQTDPLVNKLYPRVNGPSIRADIVLSLYRSKSPLLDSALTLRFQQMTQPDDYNEPAENAAMLELLFKTCAGRIAPPLSEWQRQTLRALRTRAWNGTAEYPRVIELFGNNGLPTTPQAFDRLINSKTF